MTDRAPIVYDKHGNPMKVRLIGAECIGDVSGEGHVGYRPTSLEFLEPTIWFEAIKREEIEDG